ncbi:MAG: ABC transporter permease [Clostridiales Family XIII bacterium]|jgi:ribose/xylose/arabinose/galactoside ABC-type transport system permease subunit|nr:ABC transporter permease [Clostridiales Family XIII bacterium]
MQKIRHMINAKTLTLFFLLIAVLLIFSVLSGGAILKPLNIRNILQSITIVSLLTIGAGTLMISGEIDLSLGGIGTLSAVAAAVFLKQGLPWFVALALALGIGALVGFVNAFMVNEMRFQSFIATLATASITQGVAYVISTGLAQTIDDPVFEFLGTARIANYIPYSLIIALLALIIYGALLHKTKFGRSVYLVGGNKDAARLSGIRPKRVSYALFINAAVLASLAGILLASRLMSANLVGITTSQFAGMTAAILGGISFGGGTGGMGGAFIGILILNCFNNGMTIINVPPYWQTVASGALLLFALTLDYLTAKRRHAREVRL